MKLRINILFLLFCLTVFNACLGAKLQKEIHLFDSATIIRSNDYVILGRGFGQDSAFYILGMIPVTREPNVELALSQVLEKYPEGKTLINIQIQRIDKPYFPLGLVTIVSVSADVVGSPKLEEVVETPKGK
ncbi:hypothetical protein [Leptospira ilyithenensis]|uniref:Uncharacterized protein n=1 Tax=Leptospira ilyithenensis TaxID=2484901 RepID=A0A4R9LUZ9_9LEPT|nr:hypothetical protein [Leptospira ilyithenensis]TGN13127.1 hypothetical protein EHS11_04290 [Leptospira ilyithenensis]